MSMPDAAINNQHMHLLVLNQWINAKMNNCGTDADALKKALGISTGVFLLMVSVY